MENPKKPLNQFARFTGMGIQMGVVIALGAWGGVKLDEHFQTDKLFTVILSLVAVFAAMYLVYREVTHINDDK